MEYLISEENINPILEFLDKVTISDPSLVGSFVKATRAAEQLKAEMDYDLTMTTTVHDMIKEAHRLIKNQSIDNVTLSVRRDQPPKDILAEG